MYGDHADGALFYSETFNRTPALGKHPFQLYTVVEQDAPTPGGASSHVPSQGVGPVAHDMLRDH